MEHGFTRIGVVGAGQMGHGIAQVAAQKGFSVIIQDIAEKALQKAKSKIEASTAKLVKKERLSEADRVAVLDRIETTLKLADLKDCDIIIEAAAEDVDLKVEIFQILDDLCPDETILVSNTSSISITQIAGMTNRADRILGMHFMNPVQLMKLVEVIRGLVTSDETYQRVKTFAEVLGKEVVTAEDYPGFIVNRILVPMINEACYALMERVGDVEDIDRAMRLGANHPMGPLTLADFIGLDVCLSIMHVLHDGLGDAKYRPCPLLQRYVSAGYLGRKTGRGFYNYEKK